VRKRFSTRVATNLKRRGCMTNLHPPKLTKNLSDLVTELHGGKFEESGL
jgi:ribosomal protein L1